MKCPFCPSMENKVIDSRVSREGSAIRRRRECANCGKRFTTYEYVEDVLPMVVKKDGRREPFDTQKIRTGLLKACEKRPVSVEKIREMEENIVARVMQENQSAEISSTIIGNLAMQELHKFDGVAYVRFASVYREFRDIEDFMSEVKQFIKKEKNS
ncbi:MAG: transcriptional regulator NrdR [Deltaproteobacteria bacterium]|jgi:transcriptional repressor NrdR|nr:transcriptional regulator NrdR [Deltaproteobacteria bacterium]